MLLDIESSKYSNLGTVFVINTRTGLANFYGLTKLKYVYGLIFVLHLVSTSKKSAKGVVQHSQQQLTHQRFRETLLSGKTHRIYNYSIKSKAHTNITIAQNRIALSPFDSKRFLLFDGIATLPFGHRSTEENVFFEAIAEECKWANSQLTNTPIYSSENSESWQSPEFRLPDWGFFQESYTDEELQEESAASSSRDPLFLQKRLFVLVRKKGENLIKLINKFFHLKMSAKLPCHLELRLYICKYKTFNKHCLKLNRPAQKRLVIAIYP